jgi:hypothetical protein
MPLPPPETPLYNHPLPQIEQWLRDQGCQQDQEQLHCWRVEHPTWQAEIWLDIEQLTVRYLHPEENGQDIQRSSGSDKQVANLVSTTRSFKYSLSRRDIEQAVFSGP